MSIFSNKKPAKELAPLLSDTEIDGVNYEQVLDFLISVNDADLAKIINVTKIYRKAHMDVAGVTGMKAEQPPSIFEQQSAQATQIPVTDTEAGNFLDDDDELTAAFLDSDDEPKAPTAPATKTTATQKTPPNENQS